MFLIKIFYIEENVFVIVFVTWSPYCWKKFTSQYLLDKIHKEIEIKLFTHVTNAKSAKYVER